MDHAKGHNEPQVVCQCRCPCHYKSNNIASNKTNQSDDRSSVPKNVSPVPVPRQKMQQSPKIAQIQLEESQFEFTSSETDPAVPYNPFRVKEPPPPAGTAFSKSFLHAKNIVKHMRRRWESLSEPVDDEGGVAEYPKRLSLTDRGHYYTNEKSQEGTYKSKVPENIEEHKYVLEPLQSNRNLRTFNDPYSQIRQPQSAPSTSRCNVNLRQQQNSSEPENKLVRQNLQQRSGTYNAKELEHGISGDFSKPEYHTVHQTNPFKTPASVEKTLSPPRNVSLHVPKADKVFPQDFRVEKSVKPPARSVQSEVKHIRKSFEEKVDEVMTNTQRRPVHLDNNSGSYHLPVYEAQIFSQNACPLEQSIKRPPRSVQSEMKNIRNEIEEEVDEIVANAQSRIMKLDKGKGHDRFPDNEAISPQNPFTLEESIQPVPRSVQSEVKKIRKSFEDEVDEVVTSAQRRPMHLDNNSGSYHLPVNKPEIFPQSACMLKASIKPTPRSIQSEVKNIRKSFEDEVDEIVTNVQRRPVNSHNSHDRFPDNEAIFAHAFTLEESTKPEPRSVQSEVKKIRKSFEDEVDDVMTSAQTRPVHLDNNVGSYHLQVNKAQSFQQNACMLKAPIKPIPRSIQSEVKNIRKSFEDEVNEVVTNAQRRPMHLDNNSASYHLPVNQTQRFQQTAFTLEESIKPTPHSVQSEVKNIKAAFEEEVDEIVTNVQNRPLNWDNGHYRFPDNEAIFPENAFTLEESIKQPPPSSIQAEVKSFQKLPQEKVDTMSSCERSNRNLKVGPVDRTDKSKTAVIPSTKIILSPSEEDEQNEESLTGSNDSEQKDSTYIAYISVPIFSDSSGIQRNYEEPVEGNETMLEEMTSMAMKMHGKRGEPVTDSEQDQNSILASLSKEFDEVIATPSIVHVEPIGRSVSVTNTSAKVSSRHHHAHHSQHQFNEKNQSRGKREFYICRRCHKIVALSDASFYCNGGSELAWHSHCFKCHVCKKDLLQSEHEFFDDQPYCMDHYERVANIPTCFKCQQNIYDTTYTSAGGKSWHRNHFNCQSCRRPLVDTKYVIVGNKHPHCLQCHAKHFPKQCKTCQKRIVPQESYVQVGDGFWHSTNSCLYCSSCNGSLVGRHLFFRKNERLYCNRYCALCKM